jgi:release factor glutamine methyltransferase
MAATIHHILLETVTRFNQSHIDSPATTARMVLATVLQQPREWLVAHDDKELAAVDLERIEQLVSRVIAHEPLAYIVGHREFYGIDLVVDPRVLIPRPETELLVELALEQLKDSISPHPASLSDKVVDVIDVGTGSGAVAIAICTHAPQATALATDISLEALDVARENAGRQGVGKRMRYLASDLLTHVDIKACIITANLPYVTSEEIEALPPEIQSHEPRVALDGGADGLAQVRRLLGQLDAHLLPGGAAFFEIGASQGNLALLAAQAILPGWCVELRQDLAKLDRVLVVRKRKIGLLAIDLDGTVLDDKFQISGRVRDALRDAAAQGVRVTIATGRPVPVTRPFVQSLGVNSPVLAMQGGLIYDFATETVLHELTLPHELACALAELEQRYAQWQVVLYSGEEMYVSSMRYSPDFYEAFLGANLSVHADVCSALNLRDPDKVLFIIPPEDAAKALSELGRLVGSQATVVQSHALFVEVNPRDANKGAGLARLAADLNIPREHVMAIGDQDNDVTMIEWAGLGVVMGNGSPASKAVADWIAPPIGEDGAAVAIERFILGNGVTFNAEP